MNHSSIVMAGQITQRDHLITELATALREMVANVDVSTINNSKRCTARWSELIDRAVHVLAKVRA